MYQGLSFEIEQVMPQAIRTGLFVSLCTIVQPDGTLDAGGSPPGAFTTALTDASGNPVGPYINIPCTAPPPSMARIQATEVKSLEEIMALNLKHVLLNGYYPEIEANFHKAWQAQIDGTLYSLLGAESDSQGTQTRLECKLASI